MTHDEIIAFLDHRLQASQAHDVASLVADYADDCVVESPVLGTITGRAAVQAAFDRMFAAVPDWDIQMDSRIVMAKATSRRTIGDRVRSGAQLPLDNQALPYSAWAAGPRTPQGR